MNFLCIVVASRIHIIDISDIKYFWRTCDALQLKDSLTYGANTYINVVTIRYCGYIV